MAAGDLQTARELAGEIHVNGHGGETLLDQVEPYHLTDQGNARRLVAQHGRDFKHCFPRKTDYMYDGVRFAPDNTAELVRRGIGDFWFAGTS